MRILVLMGSGLLVLCWYLNSVARLVRVRLLTIFMLTRVVLLFVRLRIWMVLRYLLCVLVLILLARMLILSVFGGVRSVVAV